MSQQKPVIEIKVDPKQLKGRRGILCSVLGIAMISTLLCLSLFSAKTGEINSESETDVCTLFLKTYSVPSTKICHYVIGGSTIVFLMMLVLLIETILAVFFTFAHTE